MCRARCAVRVCAELALTAGVLVLAYCAYSLYWTDRQASAAADREMAALAAQWDQDRPPPPAARPHQERSTGAAVPAQPGTGLQRPAPGAPFAVLRIPRLGPDWEQPVLEGRPGRATQLDRGELGRGVVHYPNTALPGQPGNFALAGHRTTYGAPFKELDLLQVGDRVHLGTREHTYTYRVTVTRIVSPEQTDVLAPVPGRPGVPADKQWITLTTCHPRYSLAQRLIVAAEQESIGPAHPA